jgi:hypothetical protein
MIHNRCNGDRRIALLAILVVLGVSCSPAPPPKPRLIVLYAKCTVNKDLLAPYADGIDFTPNFARFGHEAAVFTSHQTEAVQLHRAYQDANLESSLMMIPETGHRDLSTKDPKLRARVEQFLAQHMRP